MIKQVFICDRCGIMGNVSKGSPLRVKLNWVEEVVLSGVYVHRENAERSEGLLLCSTCLDIVKKALGTTNL